MNMILQHEQSHGMVLTQMLRKIIRDKITVGTCDIIGMELLQSVRGSPKQNLRK